MALAGDRSDGRLRPALEGTGLASSPAIERVQSIARRLGGGRFEVVVGPHDTGIASIGPGRVIYIWDWFIDRCDDDALIAMVVAHEIAHYELGHLRWWRRFLRRRRRERELEADRRAFEMCIEAGYDPERCLRLFDLLAHFRLDQGDPAGVFAREAGRGRAHPPLLAREAALRALLDDPRSDRCGHCDRGAVGACARCTRPLCRPHTRARQARCVACRSALEPLCRVCKRTLQCLACGTALVCRYCRSPAQINCAGCTGAFCRDHAPRRRRLCAACR